MTTKLVVILGSVTPPGRFFKALNLMIDESRAIDPSLEASLINLGDCKIAFADGRPPADYHDDTAQIVEKALAADVLVLATPVYRGTFTGALKNLLDHLPVESLMGKPCGIVAMGATNHHFLGADWHLRDVLAWFGAFTAPTSVYLTSTDFADGQPSDAARAELLSLVRTLIRMKDVFPKGSRAVGPLPLPVRNR
ncbi:MAG: NADPH-dependent FMN reductase [Candidatus Binatus sp.]|uniref:NADPH-dependent FMN reductase n=1 Tax=Candidatus Binatus sp. TaxID=2811406 RepID=UPI002727B270|nr:NADPH-dependent FMN reductase [Candidatus Binatus sp.]MDO8434759.1 NADPH-dependent FMN reductase [Candidatus Binatus sp.]